MQIQATNEVWVAELSLTMEDKAVLESPKGMLTDKHMDAASQLLAIHFPHIQGLQSYLKYQSSSRLISLSFGGGFMPEGLCGIMLINNLHMRITIIACFSITDPARP